MILERLAKLTWLPGCVLWVGVGTLCLFWGISDALKEGTLQPAENNLKVGLMLWLTAWIFAIVYYTGEQGKGI